VFGREHPLRATPLSRGDSFDSIETAPNGRSSGNYLSVVILNCFIAVASAMLFYIEQRPLSKFWQPPAVYPASVSEIHFEDGKFSIARFADSSHYDPEDQPSGACESGLIQSVAAKRLTILKIQMSSALSAPFCGYNISEFALSGPRLLRCIRVQRVKNYTKTQRLILVITQVNLPDNI
jgi:hypothetical protein